MQMEDARVMNRYQQTFQEPTKVHYSVNERYEYCLCRVPNATINQERMI